MKYIKPLNLKFVPIILAPAFLFLGCRSEDFRNLPNDGEALHFFEEHKAQFTEISLNMLVSNKAELLNGSDFSPQIFQYAKFNQDAAIVSFAVWGTGCVVCHDTYKGFIYIPIEQSLPQNIVIVDGLEDYELPKDEMGEIIEGVYAMPISEQWVMYRLEISG